MLRKVNPVPSFSLPSSSSSSCLHPLPSGCVKGLSGTPRGTPILKRKQHAQRLYQILHNEGRTAQSKQDPRADNSSLAKPSSRAIFSKDDPPSYVAKERHGVLRDVYLHNVSPTCVRTKNKAQTTPGINGKLVPDQIRTTARNPEPMRVGVGFFPSKHQRQEEHPRYTAGMGARGPPAR